MADVNRCIVCGAEIPEGVHICRKCDMLVKESREKSETREIEEDAKVVPAIITIKKYCTERRERLGECGKCPIKIACLNEVRVWEV